MRTDIATPDSGVLYRRAMRLLETVPQFDREDDDTEARRWAAAVAAIGDYVLPAVEQSQLLTNRAALSSIAADIAWDRIQDALFRMVASLELQVPPVLSDSFIPVGGSFDAFSALARVFGQAKKEVFIVDPYMDETVLTDFAVTIASGVGLRLLSDSSAVKASLLPAAERWTAQHGDQRLLRVRLAAPRMLHDRTVIIDGTEAWALTQSLKDFAGRAPGEMVRNSGMAELKIRAYNDIWDSAAPI